MLFWCVLNPIVIPHITDAIQEWVERVSHIPVYGDKVPDVCVVEVCSLFLPLSARNEATQ